MKTCFTATLLLLSALSFSHTIKSTYDYYVVFVGNFENDIVSLSINNKSVLKHYQVENVDPVKKGHLSLSQCGRNIQIAYNGHQITRSGKAVDFIIDFDVAVNQQKKKFKVDLRKGRVILIDYRTAEGGVSGVKTVFIEQIDEPVLLV